MIHNVNVRKGRSDRFEAMRRLYETPGETKELLRIQPRSDGCAEPLEALGEPWQYCSRAKPNRRSAQGRLSVLQCPEGAEGVVMSAAAAYAEA